MAYKVHPHEKIMRKWLNNEKIQFLDNEEWMDIKNDPCWFHSFQYRVKPKEPENIVRYVNTYCSFVGLKKTPMLHYVPCELENANLKFTYNTAGVLIDVSKV